MDSSKINELNKVLAEIWDSLTDEQKEKAKQCGSIDELTALAGEMGFELPDEMLEAVAGGASGDEEFKNLCVYCGTLHKMKKPECVYVDADACGRHGWAYKYHCKVVKRDFYYLYESDTMLDDKFVPVSKVKSRC